MKTKKNIIVTEEDGLAVDNSKSKGLSLATRKKPKTLLEAIDNINTKLSKYVREHRNEDVDLTKALFLHTITVYYYRISLDFYCLR